MFSQEEFIVASRAFVCVRLESYESKEHQDMVRSFLGGRFENTAFCLLAPDGRERLSGTGRSPSMGLRTRGRRGGRNGDDGAVIKEMARIADRFPGKGDADEPVVQDFHSFRQALNVASADQRLLLFVAAPGKARKALRKSLRPVLGDPDLLGRFHCDFGDKASDAEWAGVVSGVSAKSGIFVIQADQFGMEGKVRARLPLDAKPDAIKAALTRANAAFAREEERKVYSEHVSQGRREGVYFEGGMPYGEDRDGDGEIDHRGGRGPGERGRGAERRGAGRPPRGR